MRKWFLIAAVIGGLMFGMTPSPTLAAAATHTATKTVKTHAGKKAKKGAKAKHHKKHKGVKKHKKVVKKTTKA